MSILGSKLKEIREQKGIPLDIIFNKTRIPVPTLQKIEKNDFSGFPQAYLGSFIKSYAKEIGLSEEFIRQCLAVMDQDSETGKLFDQLKSRTVTPLRIQETGDDRTGEDQDAASEETAQTESGTRLPTEGEKIRVNRVNTLFHAYKWYGALAVVAGSFLYFLWMLVTEGHVAEPTNATPKTFDEVISEIEKDTLQVPQPVRLQPDTQKTTRLLPKQTPAVTDSSGFEYGLSITALKDSVWISLEPAGKPKLAFTLKPGQSVLRKASRFVLTVGKAESVRVLVNQKPVRLPAATGLVTGFVLDQTALKQLAGD